MVIYALQVTKLIWLMYTNVLHLIVLAATKMKEHYAI